MWMGDRFRILLERAGLYLLRLSTVVHSRTGTSGKTGRGSGRCEPCTTSGSEMYVGDWTSWDDTSLPDFVAPDKLKLHEIIAEGLRIEGFKWSGRHHRYGDLGVPVLYVPEGDSVQKYKYRCDRMEWGAIMALAYPETVYGRDEAPFAVWSFDTPPGQSASFCYKLPF